MSREDRVAYMEARIAARLAALKAGLQLKPDQEKLWPPYEKAVQDMTKIRRDRMMARREARNDKDASSDKSANSDTSAGSGDKTDHQQNAASRMRQRAEAMVQTGQALKALADAQEPLFASFDEGQKRRFGRLAHGGMGNGMMGMMGHGMMDHERHGRDHRGHHRHQANGENGWRALGGRDRWRNDNDDHRMGSQRGEYRRDRADRDGNDRNWEHRDNEHRGWDRNDQRSERREGRDWRRDENDRSGWRHERDGARGYSGRDARRDDQDSRGRRGWRHNDDRDTDSDRGGRGSADPMTDHQSTGSGANEEHL